MTHKYECQCWSCGSHNMEPDSHGVRCTDCGATWNEVPALGGLTVEIHNIPGSKKTGYGSETSGTPSRSVSRKAAWARVKKMM